MTVSNFSVSLHEANIMWTVTGRLLKHIEMHANTKRINGLVHKQDRAGPDRQQHRQMIGLVVQLSSL